MRWRLLLGLAVLAVALLPSANAQADASLVIEAYDERGECPGDRSYCYEVEEGNLGQLEPGARVEITLVNEGDLEHELALAALEDADQDHKETSEEDALDEIPPIGPGERATKVFEIPETVEDVYLWCDIGAHEELGMWLSTDADGEGAENGAPAPLAGVAVAVATGALLRRTGDG